MKGRNEGSEREGGRERGDSTLQKYICARNWERGRNREEREGGSKKEGVKGWKEWSDREEGREGKRGFNYTKEIFVQGIFDTFDKVPQFTQACT